MSFVLFASAAPAPAVTSPNFVVVVTDDQRWDTIGRCSPNFDPFDLNAGADSCMPNLSQDLVSAGTTFLKGEVTQALCCPSRASILSGQYSSHTGVVNLTATDFQDESSLATWLDDAGYRTGLFGKYLNGYGSGPLDRYIPPGWDSFHSFHGIKNSDNPYIDYPWIDWDAGDFAPVTTRHRISDSTSVEACAPGNLYSTDLLCNQSLSFLTEDQTTPFLLYVAPISPHAPTIPASRHAGMYSELPLTTYPDYNVIPSPNPPSYLPPGPIRPNTLSRQLESRRASLEAVRAADDMIGVLHDQLIADGRIDNTVWVFISDNGIAAAEHRLTSKQCSYRVCHRVPFVVVCPPNICAGATAGAVDSSNYALNIDIAPTLTELAGVTPGHRVDGRSLVPILDNQAAPWRTEWLLYENLFPTDGVVATAADGATYKYLIHRNTGEVELYNLTEDEWELVNLWGNPAYAAVQTYMALLVADGVTNPILTITSVPPDSSETTATIAFSSNEPVTFECSLDGAAATICGSGTSGSTTYEGLSVATHTAAVQAIDRFNNVSAVSTVTFIVTEVGTPPPAPTLTQIPPDPSGPNVTFQFSNAEPGVTFDCTLDGATSACSSPASYSELPDGAHTFSVVAINTNGTSDPATHSWTSTSVGSPPPAPTLTQMPPDPSPPGVTFQFSNAEPGVTFDCTLDGATSACSSPASYSNLPDGAHTFSVVAINTYGSSDPATYTWTSTTPSLLVTVTRPVPDTLATSPQIRVLWTGSPEIISYQVYERIGVEGAPLLVATQPKASYTRTGVAGTTYCHQIHGFDNTGASAISDLVCSSVAADDRSPAIAYSGPTEQVVAIGAYQGTLTVLNGTEQLADFTFVGRKIGILAQTSPSSGIAEIWVDGVLTTVVDLYATRVREQQLVWTGTLAFGTHNVQVRWTGIKATNSTGTGISIDGVGWIG